jgi:hypothetical protein
MRMVNDLIVNYDLHKKLDMIVVPLLHAAAHCDPDSYMLLGYSACNLAGDDQVPYRRIHRFPQKHYARSTGQIPAANGPMYWLSH